MTIAFDLIIHEYGWSDEYILDLTIRRFRWAIEAIERRLKRDRKERTLLVQAQTTTIAAGFKVMVDKKAAGRFNRWLAGIRFWREDDDDVKDELTADTYRGRKLPSAEQLLGMANRKR